jgi:ubiquinone/menaquinone biosynthesis C-methylase UbiE
MHDPAARRPRNGLFDLLAPAWEGLMGAWGIGDVVETLDHRSGQRLVDLGGGVGRLARYIDRNARLVIVDPSGPMVRRGRRRGRVVGQARAEALPLASGTVERIVVLDAFHHMHDLPRAAAEIARVLAPGGRAVLFEPDPETFAGGWIARLERWTGMGSLLLRGEQLVELFSSRGLTTSLSRGRFHLLLVAERPQRST